MLTQKQKKRIKTVSAILLWMLVAAEIVVIFSFSADNAAESSHKSSQISKAIAPVVEPSYNTMTEPEKTAVITKIKVPVRKAAHFAEYGLLGMTLCLALFITGLTGLSGKGIAAAASLLTAAFDELSQGSADGRAPLVTDVLIDFAGAVCGIVLIWLMLTLIKKKKSVKGMNI